MTRAAVALGSNLGDRRANLEYALEAMTGLGDLVAVSRLYETAPVGGPEQDAYLNAVAILETRLPAERLLAALLDIEHRRGRERLVRWGPRTLDLDLLLYGVETIGREECTVPHPRLLERRFVLDPLLDAWPEAVLPDGTPVASYRAEVADQHVNDLGSWWSPDPSVARFRERGGWWIVAQAVIIGGVAVALGVDGASLPGGVGVELLGALLAIAGVAEAGLGLLQLGDRLTPFPEPLDGGGIVHGGVYSAARHPIYGGIVLGMVGAAVFQRSVTALGLSLGAGVFFWLKAGREEARLMRRFPGYVQYRAGTRARLIPWVI
jgi:2-amino-4-hydroxy-6-hydroxymethyldihydropteridine diphosphokinase